jgi:hypothetical protein
MKSDLEKHLYLPEYMNYKRENLSVKDYMARIEPDNIGDISENNVILIEHENSNTNNLIINSPIHNLFPENDKSIKENNESFHENNNQAKSIGKTVKKNINIQSIFKRRKSSLNVKNIFEFKKQDNKSVKINVNDTQTQSKKIPYNKNKFGSMLLTWSKSENIGQNQIAKSSKNSTIFDTSPKKKNVNDDKKARKSNFNSSMNVLNQNQSQNVNQENNSTQFNNLNRNNEENNEKKNNKNRKQNIILWSYFHVTNLIDGQTFGDVALSEDNKRRTASIITQDRTICGTLDYYIYNKFIKDSQKKIRKNIVHALLNVNFLRGINAEFFEEHYFNMFKYENIQRNNYLFKSGDERNSLYIVFSGEIEVNIKCTIQQLNKILKLKKVSLDKAIVYENRLCELNEFFNRFYNNSQNIYRIKIHSFGSCIGLDEYIIRKSENGQSHNNCKDIFYVDTKCVSDKAELYSIDYKLLFNIFKTEKMEKKFHKILKNSEN